MVAIKYGYHSLGVCNINSTTTWKLCQRAAKIGNWGYSRSFRVLQRGFMNTLVKRHHKRGFNVVKAFPNGVYDTWKFCGYTPSVKTGFMALGNSAGIPPVIKRVL